MKMRLPITEQFLWAIYHAIEGLGMVNEVLGPRTFNEAFCPEVRRIRYEMQRKIGKRNFAQLVYHLKKSGFIRTPDWDPKAGIIVTQKGMEKIFRTKLRLQDKKKRADKKWEMVVFDVSEKKRKARDEFRSYLKILGFKLLSPERR